MFSSYLDPVEPLPVERLLQRAALARAHLLHEVLGLLQGLRVWVGHDFVFGQQPLPPCLLTQRCARCGAPSALLAHRV